MSEADSKSVTVHPYGPTLGYLDYQLSGTDGDYFSTLHDWVGIALEYPDGIPHASIYAKKDAETGELERGNTESVFVDRICELSGRTGTKRISGELHTLKRLTVFRSLAIDDEKNPKIFIVPKWTSEWYYSRIANGPDEENDHKFFRQCIKAMWFIGQEWEALYSMRHMLDSIPKDKWVSKSEIWTSMQKKYSYRTNEKYTNTRVSLVLNNLILAGLVTSGKDGYRNVDADNSRCEPFRNDWCPILRAEKLHRGLVLEYMMDRGTLTIEQFDELKKEIFGQWAIASVHIESHTATTGSATRANTGAFNKAMCRIQEAIWGGKYDSHVYQAAKSRKKREHPLNGTVWPLYRVDNLTDNNLSRWGSTTWDLLSLNKILEANLSQPRRSEWVGEEIDGKKTSRYYKRKTAEIIGVEDDDPIITSIGNWGGNAFKFLEHLEFVKTNGGTEEQLRYLLGLSIPEFKKELMMKNLDPNRAALTYPVEFKPHAWQNDATEGWWSGTAKLAGTNVESIEPQTGIVEVVTGAGKTVFAIKLIKEFLDKDDENKALIIVPTEVLLHQWYSELAKYLNLGPRQVSLIGDNNHGSLSEEDGTRVAIGIVNSLSLDYVHERIISKGMPNPGNLLVIADECHRFRGEKFRKAMEWYIRDGDSKLGLSATPLGEKDDVDIGEDDSEASKLIVAGFLGDRSYFYGYERARDDNLIPDFTINLVGFDLSPRERTKYKLYSEKISRSRKKILDAVGYRLDRMRGGFEAKINKLVSDGMKIPGVKDYFEAIRDRKELLSHGIDGAGLDNRQDCFGYILKSVLVDNGRPTDKKALVFQERISQIQDTMIPPRGEIRKMLDSSSETYRPSSVHSRRARYRDKMTLDLLRQGIVNVIYSAKKLDEGLDVPAVDVGIVRIPTSSLRTTIQRLGRILRTKEDKEKSDFWVLYARDTTETRFFENADFRERISDDVIQYYTWNTEAGDIYEQDESEIIWGPQTPDIDWSSISIGDSVRVRVEGGQFSVSSDWIPFVKQKNDEGNMIRMSIRNPDYIEIASVMKEMNKAGAVYHDLNGNCVTYRKGKGGTFIGTIDTSVELDLAPYPRRNQSNRSPNLIRAPSGSNLEKLLGMLSDDDDVQDSN